MAEQRPDSCGPLWVCDPATGEWHRVEEVLLVGPTTECRIVLPPHSPHLVFFESATGPAVEAATAGVDIDGYQLKPFDAMPLLGAERILVADTRLMIARGTRPYMGRVSTGKRHAARTLEELPASKRAVPQPPESD